MVVRRQQRESCCTVSSAEPAPLGPCSQLLVLYVSADLENIASITPADGIQWNLDVRGRSKGKKMSSLLLSDAGSLEASRPLYMSIRSSRAMATRRRMASMCRQTRFRRLTGAKARSLIAASSSPAGSDRHRAVSAFARSDCLGILSGV